MGNLFPALRIVLLLAAPPPELLRLYDYDSASPLELQDAGAEAREGLEIHDISYSSPKGGRVAGHLVVPPGRGPFAGLIFMHGAGGSRKLVEHMIAHEFYFLSNVRSYSRNLVMDSMSDSSFTFFSTALPRCWQAMHPDAGKR